MLASLKLTSAIAIALGDLQRYQTPQKTSSDGLEISELALDDSQHEKFEPFIFTTWKCSQAPPWLNKYIFQPYIRHATSVVRRPSDVIYISHLLVLSLVGMPSLVLLFMRFSWIHAVVQELFVLYFLGPYTIIIHHHMHGRGIMSPRWGWLDATFPYILGPMMGHNWSSFYYHHKHHHVEDNGPGDLSSTLRYDRDSALGMAYYIARFVLFNWLETPLYYVRKNKLSMAFKSAGGELISLSIVLLLARINFRAAMTALVLTFVQLRILVILGNWGQHGFIDEEDPGSSFRSSITLVGPTANQCSLNDGYHTSHHLAPHRHWYDHPAAFIKARDKYSSQSALTFQNISFFGLAIFLCRKDYGTIADCLVPMGDQVDMTRDEIIAMLKRKTRKFSEVEIEQKFAKRIASK